MSFGIGVDDVNWWRVDEQIDLAIQRAGGFILAFGLAWGILG